MPRTSCNPRQPDDCTDEPKPMKRRRFLAASAALALLASPEALAAKKPPAKAKPAPKKAKSANGAAPANGEAAASGQEIRNVVSLPDEPAPQWRTYDLITTLGVASRDGPLRVWLPLAQYKDTPWERSLGHHFEGNYTSAGIYRDPVAEMEVFYADWTSPTEEARLSLTSRVATQDRTFDVTRRSSLAERGEVLRRCLQARSHLPLDGVVRRTAERAIGRIKDPLAMGKAIYDWVVDNTRFVAGPASDVDIGVLLENGDVAGNSTVISLLFVALCRSVGIPARPVFGLRIDHSRLFAGLGQSGDLSTAQQCRAEFYSPGYGWIAVNPSDVREAIADEGISAGDPKLTVLRKLLFGFWEMNWISYNAALDVSLRGSEGQPLPFLARPQAEAGGQRFDSRDARLAYAVRASRAEP